MKWDSVFAVLAGLGLQIGLILSGRPGWAPMFFGLSLTWTIMAFKR
jgi:hypothetical protein